MPQMRAVMSGASVNERPAEQRLEEPRRLEDAQLDVLDAPVREPHGHRALALDAREVVGMMVRRSATRRPPSGTPRRPR